MDITRKTFWQLAETYYRLGNINWALTKVVKTAPNYFYVALAGFIGASKKHQ
jgi:hypothetical protein